MLLVISFSVVESISSAIYQSTASEYLFLSSYVSTRFSSVGSPIYLLTYVFMYLCNSIAAWHQLSMSI